MNKKLQNIIDLSRTPMLVLRDGKLLTTNSAARDFLPELVCGCSAAEIIPEHILSEPADSFVSSAVICGKSCAVSILRSDDALLLSLSETQSSAGLRGCLSDSLLNEMLSSLFSIRLSAARLENYLDLSNPDAKKYYAILNHNYYSLNRRLSNLNLLRALQDRDALMVPRYTDLVSLCSETVSTVSLLMGPARARVEFICALDTLPACVDAPKVELLMLNLLSNSLLHTPQDGLVRLKLSTQGGSAVLSVDDNGCGIHPEKLGSVFTAYENRLNEHTLSSAEGGGLGLALCRAIAELHGGALILESRPGEGTSVRALLPVDPPAGAELRSDSMDYVNGGMDVILTELCDVLDYSAYTPAYLD